MSEMGTRVLLMESKKPEEVKELLSSGIYPIMIEKGELGEDIQPIVHKHYVDHFETGVRLFESYNKGVFSIGTNGEQLLVAKQITKEDNPNDVTYVTLDGQEFDLKAIQMQMLAEKSNSQQM